jgi:hypothetical protein
MTNLLKKEGLCFHNFWKLDLTKGKKVARQKKNFNIINLSIKDVVILIMINFINPYKCWQYLNEKHMGRSGSKEL